MKLFEDVIRYERLKADKDFGETLRFAVVANGEEILSGRNADPCNVYNVAMNAEADYILIEKYCNVSSVYEKMTDWQKFYDLKAFQDTYC
jgi:predicted nucleic acid-binding Zn finger protein